MASSRVVLSPIGWSAIVGGLATLLVGLVTLNLLLLLVPLTLLSLVLSEVIAFDRSTRDFGPNWFQWRRFENSSQVRIDGVGSMALDLVMSGPGAVYTEVFDPQPEGFEVVRGSPRLLTWWDPANPVRVAYAYRPRSRGRFRVGPTVIVAHDALGFAFRMTKLENRWEVLVTPSLTVEEASSLPISGRRAASEAYVRRTGPGSEFRSLREYEVSDDARKIAWRKSGIDKIYVREHEEEAHPEVMVLLDCGRDMRLGMPGSDCLELAVDGGTVIAGQAIGRSDRVSLLVYSDHPHEFVAPQRGPGGAEILTQAFGRATLSSGRFNLAGALAHARDQLTAPTTIFLLSSMVSPSGAVETAVAELRTHGHRLIVICPEVPALYPAEPDELARHALEFSWEPIAREVGLHVRQLEVQGVPVVRYVPAEVRVVAAELLELVRSAGSLS